MTEYLNLKIATNGLTIECADIDELDAILERIETKRALFFPVARAASVAPIASAEDSEETTLRAEFEQANGFRFTTRGRCEKDGALEWLRDWKANQSNGSEGETAETGAEGEEL